MAQFFLGGMYYTGDGVPQNYDEAIKWWGRSAKQGEILAKGMLESTVKSLSLLKQQQGGGRAEILRKSVRKRSSALPPPCCCFNKDNDFTVDSNIPFARISPCFADRPHHLIASS
jgi:hypothetical protein